MSPGPDPRRSVKLEPQRMRCELVNQEVWGFLLHGKFGVGPQKMETWRLMLD